MKVSKHKKYTKYYSDPPYTHQLDSTFIKIKGDFGQKYSSGFMWLKLW